MTKLSNLTLVASLSDSSTQTASAEPHAHDWALQCERADHGPLVFRCTTCKAWGWANACRPREISAYKNVLEGHRPAPGAKPMPLDMLADEDDATVYTPYHVLADWERMRRRVRRGR